MAHPNLSIALSLSLAFFLVLTNSAEEFSFTFPQFVPSQSNRNLILQGDTTITTSGKLQLTTVDDDGTPTYNSLGRALYAAPFRLYDSDTGNVASWATSFTFNFTALNKTATANGLAFFLTYPSSEPKSGGGYLGLFDSSTYNKSVQTVAVEFDTYVDSDWDPSNRHIGIDVNTIKSIKTASWGLANGQLASILITYDPSTTLLVASLIHQSRRTSYILSEKVNLSTVLPEWVSIGFSATTGETEGYAETHDVLSWSFASKLSDDSTKLSLASFVLNEAV